MKTIALDADEVLFGFAAAYAQWRTDAGMPSFDPAALTAYDFAAAIGDDAADNEHSTAFLADPATLAIPPLPGAAAAIEALSETHRLVVVTNRYALTQGDSTNAWVQRWLPGISEVICARAQRGDRGPGKAAICAQLGAAWLVDDTPSHLEGLGATRGLLYGRYPWQGSCDHLTRADTWDEALEHLQ